MKPCPRLLPLLVFALPVLACGGFRFGSNLVIVASAKAVRETREASGFHAVEMRGIGNVVLTQGETESLEVSGPDNVVPLVKTYVRGGVLIFELEPGVVVTGMSSANDLTYTVGVKDLSALTVSGLGDLEMDKLSAAHLNVRMSGTGRITLRSLALGGLDLTLSGMGDAVLSGEAADVEIDISGAGNVNAPDLKIQAGRIDISGAGSATVWVTENLTGTISGAGMVEYYGDPQTDFNNSGLGAFKSLGRK
jgi:hypothetical protein